MKNFKSHFKFNKQERSGIFFLLLIIVLFQVGYFVYRSLSIETVPNSFALDSKAQAQIDILKKDALLKDSIKIYPFNPNFITDYKGYTLGMSTVEIDRLHSFRKSNEYVNSFKEFQQVTLISDSLLKAISPYFKFPDWTKKRNSRWTAKSKRNEARKKGGSETIGAGAVLSMTIEIKDLNTATAEELKTVNGIGEKLSKRIIKFRDRLGGFLIDEQLYDVYGLEPDVVQRTFKKFKVIDSPKIDKINVNWASYNELRNLLYINDKFAKSIIEYRKSRPVKSLSELKTLEGFPEGRFERIKLYLSL